MNLQSDIYVTIPTVPERAEMAEPLLALMKPIFGEHVQLYQDLDRSLVYSHPKSWISGAEHGLLWTAVAEDDIILSRDFADRLPVLLDEAVTMGFYVVNLYSNYAEDIKSLSRGEHWRTHPGRSFLNEQFLIMRTEIIPDFESFYQGLDLTKFKRGWSDVLLSQFFVSHSLDVHIVLPNLVDHRNEKSTIGYPPKVGGVLRKSRTFGLL